MRVLLLSIYDCGHQPFALASMAAWLRAGGHEVSMADLALDSLPTLVVREAEVVALSLPMHTAARMAAPVIARIRRLNPGARLAAFGIYASLNRDYLLDLGVEFVIGGEFEASFAAALLGVPPPLISLDRLRFQTPDRVGLPGLARYPKLRIGGETRRAGYTEASRGCRHLCRHCPVVPVYQGTFRVVQADVVLEDIRRQVAAGAEHITFGDPDFLNGPTHARRIVEAVHAEFPNLTWDATAKIEHLLRHRDLLPRFRDSGCVFVTSAVESLNDAVLGRLDKGHTRQDFLDTVAMFDAIGLALSPTFIPFTPWTSRADYVDLLRTLARLGLAARVSPVQLALRLLVTAESGLLELEDVRDLAPEYDESALLYRWRHPDGAMDVLAADALRLVHAEQKHGSPRELIFRKLYELAADEPLYEDLEVMPRATVPYLDEPWYC